MIFVLVLHVLVCLMLILVVLLQPGNKGGMGAAFGGGGGGTVFGGRGANTFLAKLTAGAAVVFMVTSFSLVYFSSKTGSAFERVEGAMPAETEGEGDEAAEGEDADTAASDTAATDGADDDTAASDTGNTGGEAATDGEKPADAAPTEGAAAPAPAEGAAAPAEGAAAPADATP